ncbi:hypothetical protein [Streptosporangium roseum]|uniref:hypothetical protein n=1 Tax=Streptosporangium roseum TaxID=2001 RepID=UPI00146D085A|nr:hypothetical protein [Streptosporangium roseum]
MPRPRRVGPLRLAEEEFTTLSAAAKREGPSVGAYVTSTALTVAQERLTPVPADWRA